MLCIIVIFIANSIFDIFFFFLMIRRPPRSTRTEHTLSLHDALPISGGIDREADASIGSVCAASDPRLQREGHGRAGPKMERGQTSEDGDRKSTRLNSSH